MLEESTFSSSLHSCWGRRDLLKGVLVGEGRWRREGRKAVRVLEEKGVREGRRKNHGFKYSSQ
jgi:hypothetical protein